MSKNIGKPDPSRGIRAGATNRSKVGRASMAVTMDIGDHSDIHPANKQDMGYRLAKEAQRICYNYQGITACPLYRSIKIKSNKIKIFFDNASSGLSMRDNKLQGFEIANGTQKIVHAKALI
jgi:sialate O-acetylesterase